MISKILIKNVFYMLAYAASCLNVPTERNLDSEKFEHIEDLFAFILNSWMSQQIKRGLYSNYLDRTDNLSTMKGKLNINGTINNIIAHRRQLSCNFDELTINNLFNQIIKSAMLLLLRQVTNVSKEQKTSLRLNLHLLPEIQEINLFKLNWSVVKFNRFNKNYEWPILICQYLVNNLLPSERDGADHFCIDIDKSLSKLFENFVLNYFKFHWDGSISANLTLRRGSRMIQCGAAGNGRLDAVANAIEQAAGMDFTLIHYSEHALDPDTDSRACSYVGLKWPDGRETWGCGTHTDIIVAGVRALVSAINNR